MDKIIKKKLEQEVKCPVCMEFMSPPITLCENGHNICSACRPKLHYCPTCVGGFTTVRNTSIENLTKEVKYTCQYRKRGCRTPITMHLNKKHKQECTYGPLKCPFNQTWTKCSWLGPQADMKKHLQSVHKEKDMFLDMSAGMENFCENLTDMTKHKRWQQAIFTLNQVFFWYTHIIGTYLYTCVQYVGPKTKASKYKYKFTIKSADNLQLSMSSTHVCLGYDVDVSERIRNKDCVLFPYKSVKKCMTKEDSLVVQFEVCSAAS